jgi:uncharacterized OB-fold protein
VCATCYTDEEIEPVELGTFGKTYSVAVQRMMPVGRESSPYVVCYVDLEGSGVRLFGKLDCEPEEAQIGMSVEVVVDIQDAAPDGFVYYHFRKQQREAGETVK